MTAEMNSLQEVRAFSKSFTESIYGSVTLVLGIDFSISSISAFSSADAESFGDDSALALSLPIISSSSRAALISF